MPERLVPRTTATATRVGVRDAGGSAFSFKLAAWGLGQLVLGLLSLGVLMRYRSLVPPALLALLAEQLGRTALRSYWPIGRVAAPGGAINLALTAILVAGLGLSLWPARTSAAGA